MKKITILICVLFLISTIFAFGCNSKKPTPPHNHSYSSEYTYNDTHHWFSATCGCTDTVKGKEAHDNADTCKCGYKKQTPPNYGEDTDKDVIFDGSDFQ